MQNLLNKNLSRRGFAVASALSAIALAGCSSSSSDDSGSTATTDDATESTGLKICIITTSGIDDGSFNQNCYEGIQAFIAENSDCTVTDVKEEDYNELVPTVEGLVGDYDVFVLPGYNFATVGEVAEANPDVYFIVIDSTITDTEGNAMSLDNVFTTTYYENQSGFFAGIAAAMETTTNKVAVVNGIAYPSNVNYQYGFMSGVNYANKYYGTSAEIVEIASYSGTDVLGNVVGGNYIGDFADEATGKVVGEALIAEDVDIIFVAAGSSGNGTFTAIKEASGVYAIGVDVDQYDDGANGDTNIILTSVLKIMDEYVQLALQSIVDGTFEGQDLLLGMTDDPAGVGYVSEEGRQQLSDETLAALEEVYALLADGTIVPAGDATYDGLSNDPTDFVGL